MIKALFAVFSPPHVQGGENITQATVKMVAAASSNIYLYNLSKENISPPSRVSISLKFLSVC